MNRYRYRLLLPGLTLIMTSFAALPTFADSEVMDRILAVADEGVILYSEFNREWQILQKDLRSRGEDQRLSEEDLRQQLLERLILEDLQLQLGQRANIIIGDEELNRTINRIAGRNNMSLQQFRISLQRSGENWQDFRENLRRDMILQQVQQGFVRSRVEINAREIENYLASEAGQELQKNEYRLEHLRLKLSPDADDAAQNLANQCLKTLQQQLTGGVALNQLKAENDCRFSANDLGWREQRQIPGIFEEIVPLLAVGDTSEPIRNRAGLHLVRLAERRSLASEIIEQVQVRHILLKPSTIFPEPRVLERLQEFKRQIEAGEAEFSDLAQLHSEDPGSKLEGGDLGWSAAGTFTREFERQMFATPNGAISEPFESRFGWHILQVIDRRTVDIGPEKLKDRVFGILFSRKFDRQLKLWHDQLMDEAHIEINW